MQVIAENRILEIHYLDEDVLNSFSDVLLISTEGIVLPTNRLVLSSCSKFLEDVCLSFEGFDSETIISTDICAKNLQILVDFVTKGYLPFTLNSDNSDPKLDPILVDDFSALGINLEEFDLDVIEVDATVSKSKDDEPASDQPKIVKLDWDILGAALDSIGGIDSQQSTAVEVVSSEGEPQQIIIQPGDGNFLAHLSGSTVVDENPEPHASKTAKTRDYIAASAKMRRVLNTSRHMLPLKRPWNFEGLSGGRPRGRPRKIPGLFERKPRGRPLKKVEAKKAVKEEEDKQEVIERPGRRPVKKPKRYEDDIKQEPEVETILMEMEDLVETDLDGDFVTAAETPKVGTSKPKAPRTYGSDYTPRWVTCVACGKICKTNYLYKIHLKNYGPYHNNQCALCEEEFSTWEEHIAHLRDKHNGEYKYKCGLCPEIFETEERQRIHRHEMHTKKNKDKTACDKCGKVVIDYVAHQENFHGTEEHPCQHCSKVFGHAMALKRHIKDNHRQFPCEHCGNIMKNFKKYRLHILSVHTPENLKPYQCTVCIPSKGFATKWNLSEHMNKHTLEKPFHCRYCSAAFSTTSSRCHHEKVCSVGKKSK